MSTLSRLRLRLRRIEATGKRLKRELEDAKAARGEGTEVLTRTEERRLLGLEKEYRQARADWARVWQLVRDEERRLIKDPNAFLHFT